MTTIDQILTQGHIATALTIIAGVLVFFAFRVYDRDKRNNQLKS